MPAAIRFGEPADGVIALPRPLFLRRVNDLIGKICQQGRVPLLPQQNAIRRLPIASGASGFLVILLDRFGQRQMHHRPHRSLVDAQSEGDRAHQHAHFIRHPAFLVVPSLRGLHLAVIADGGNLLLFEKVHRLFNFGDGRRVNNDAAVLVVAQGAQQQARLLAPCALLHQIAQVRPVKAGNVLVRIAQLQLMKNVVTHSPGGAGGKGRDGTIRKVRSQPAQLPVFGTKLMPPFGDAMRFIDGEESDGHSLQPADGVGPRQPLRRKIQQAVLALRCLAYDLRLLFAGQRTVQHGGRDSHLRQLRRLVLHQRDQWRDHDGGSSQHHRRQLVAERFSAAGRHDHATVPSRRAGCARCAPARAGTNRIPNDAAACSRRSVSGVTFARRTMWITVIDRLIGALWGVWLRHRRIRHAECGDSAQL